MGPAWPRAAKKQRARVHTHTHTRTCTHTCQSLSNCGKPGHEDRSCLCPQIDSHYIPVPAHQISDIRSCSRCITITFLAGKLTARSAEGSFLAQAFKSTCHQPPANVPHHHTLYLGTLTAAKWITHVPQVYTRRPLTVSLTEGGYMHALGSDRL